MSHTGVTRVILKREKGLSLSLSLCLFLLAAI
uniref:Uncharacterized protein n=1 Tax=Rhizophora mucronata TaxID=61149 RepID=A0A2P2J1R9_RHIMU